MELLYFLEPNKKLLLSASQAGLYLHTMYNERFLRPALLCSNYESGLCGALYNGSLYYSYINKEHSLLIRCLRDSSLPFRLDSTSTVTYREPQLAVFNNSLFLFYFETENNTYQFKMRQLFTETQPHLPRILEASFSELPILHILATKQFLYLLLTAGQTSVLFRYHPDSSFRQLSSEEEYLAKLRLPWESEKKELEQSLIQAVQLSGQQQSLLTEKEQKLQATETILSGLSSELKQTKNELSEKNDTLQHIQLRLTECEQSRQQATHALEHTQQLLNRAKTQYNELMQVAEQYRLEAQKWYGKFTDRH
ncbi:MAG: hypothetical protein IJZ55_13100 [Lachnospiraceae bacterium]|nr:hypothetical protein [Lachnospiraceae bacterium]